MVNFIRLLMNRSIIIAFLFSGLFVFQGVKSYRLFMEKTNAQNDIIAAIQSWKNDYRGLTGSAKKWDKTYHSDANVQDLLSLTPIIGLENYGLHTDTDKLTLNNIDPIHHNSIVIGLIKVCVSTGGSALEVQADNYKTLFEGLKKLADRSDITINEIIIRGDKAMPTAFLNDFCVLLRKP